MCRYFTFWIILFTLCVNTIFGQTQCPSPTGVNVSATNICLGSSLTLSANIPTGTTMINWYTSATGGTPFTTTTSSSITYTPTAAGTFTYYAEAVGAGGNQTVQTFSYTGAVQQVTLQPGTYLFEVWGANGGSNASNSGTVPGKGGYSSGTLTLNAATLCYIYVGGIGNGGSQPLGGFNSGNTTTKTNLTGATGGGGASDVRVLVDNLYNRIIVAGGGGGQGNTTGSGGNGGGMNGQNGQGTSANVGQGGLQNAPGVYPGGGDAKPAAFGEGSDGPTGTTGGQGGGGWYGGSFGTRTNGGGAGGSGYVLTAASFKPTGYFSQHTNYYFSNPVTNRADEMGFVANPVANGTGYIRITVQGNSCTPGPRVATSTVTVNAKPTVNIDKSGVLGVCSGDSITINVSGGINYTWLRNNVIFSSGTSSVFKTNTPGDYKVVAFNTLNCTDTSAVIKLLQSTYPIVNLGNDTSICEDKTLTLDAKNPNFIYLWNTSATTQTINVIQPGSYSVKVTNPENCSTHDTIYIGHYLLPVINIPNDTAICEGDEIALNAFNNNATYLWNTGSTNASINVDDTGTYKVTVKSNHGCIASDSVKIDVNSLPLVNLGPDQDLCTGNNLVITAGNPGSIYLWNDNSNNMLKTIFLGGTYFVRVTDANACSNTDTIIVTQHNLPIINLGVDTTICANTPLIIDAANTGSDFEWNTGAISQTITVDSTKTYTVKVTDQYGCINYDTIHVESKPDPTTEGFTFIPKFFEQIGSVGFSPIMPKHVNSYQWNFGDSTESFQVAPNHTYKQSGYYDVTLTVVNDCGSNIYTQRIQIDLTNIENIKHDDLGVAVYPNPTNSILFIEMNDPTILIDKVIIYNAIGQNMTQMQVDKLPKAVYNVEKLVNGRYYIQIETNRGIAILKFEVVK